jgi:hypothetical protein
MRRERPFLRVTRAEPFFTGELERGIHPEHAMTTGKRTSEGGLAPRLSYRPEQSTLIEDVESPSIVPRPPIEKNRGH